MFIIDSYEELEYIHKGEEFKPKSEELHMDLILTKLSDKKIVSYFSESLTGIDFYDVWEKYGYDEPK